jgi:N-acetylglutamate synthase-like GNAT family acetyltransferase
MSVQREPTIRAATDDDAVAIAELLGELGYPTDDSSVPARLANMRADGNQWTLLAEADGDVVGMATIVIRHVINRDEPYGRLASVVVREEWRSHGVGAALMARTEEICRAAGCSAIEVTSADHRPRAHDFYRRLGFAERPRRFIKQL